MYRKMLKKLSKSKPWDLLLITGLIELNIVAAGMLISLHGKVNLLLFQSQSEKYVKRTVDFTGLGELVNGRK